MELPCRNGDGARRYVRYVNGGKGVGRQPIAQLSGAAVTPTTDCPPGKDGTCMSLARRNVDRLPNHGAKHKNISRKVTVETTLCIGTPTFTLTV